MKLEEFEEKMKNASPVFDKEAFLKATKQVQKEKHAPENLPIDLIYQLITAGEEVAELTKEVSKYVRKRNNVLQITEEIADVILVIENVKLNCGITDEDVAKALNVKVERIEEALDKGTFL